MKTKMQKYENTRNWARGCKKKKGGVKSSQAKPSPKLHLQPPAFEKTCASLYKLPDPVYVIYCKNTQHQTCREFQDDSNHIKN